MNTCSYRCCTKGNKETKKIGMLSSVLRIVAEENRLKLLCILRHGEHCVCELMEHVNLSQSLISHHLQDLKLAGIVTHEKRGLRVYYSLTDEGKQVTSALFQIPTKEGNI